MTHTDDHEINRDNTKIVTKKFSVSLRTKTIWFFVVALLIPFFSAMLCIMYYIPSLYSKYEDESAGPQVLVFLRAVQDGIRNIRVNGKRKKRTHSNNTLVIFNFRQVST